MTVPQSVTIPQAIALALGHHQSGSLRDAEDIYRQVLSVDPNHFDALHLLGVLLHQSGQHNDAIELIQKAITINPYNAAAHNNLGEACRAVSHFELAETHYRQAIFLKPDYAEALSNLSSLLNATGRPDEALSFCSQAVAIKPDYAAAWFVLVNSYIALEQLKDAENACRQAISFNPKAAEPYNHLGTLLYLSGRKEEAESAYRSAISNRPDFVEALSNLAALYLTAGHAHAALPLCRKAAALRPSGHLEFCQLGSTLWKLGMHQEAQSAYQEAIVNNPCYAPAFNDLGNLLKEQGLIEPALAAYQKALALQPDYIEILNNRGNALRDAGRIEEAISSFELALTLNPNLPGIQSNLLLTLSYHAALTDELLFTEHVRRCAPFHPSSDGSSSVGPSNKKLKIGFVSADMGRHPVGYLLYPVLRHISHDQYDIICYSDRENEDDVSEQMKASVTVWHRTFGLDDDSLETMIKEDGIDILVDLAGHTARNRFALFARKPAPLQVSWLGYWTTTGLRTIDYVFMDQASVIPEAVPYFTEQLFLLPHSRFCYMPFENAPEVAPLPASLHGYVTFGSFNNLSKLTPDVIALWAELLQSVPNSRLILKWHTLADEVIRERLCIAFEKHGVRREQLELRTASSHLQMLREYSDVDIALDPFPFSGGITSCEALWMGVPVITLPGSRPVSRQTSSFLRLIEMEQCAAQSSAEYMTIARQLAEDLLQLAALRASLRTRMSRSPLCDAPQFAQNLEAAFQQIWSMRAPAEHA